MSYANTVKLESKVLQFEFNYSQVQFNKNGKYFLRFTIHNHHREDLLPQVQLEKNNSRKRISYREIVTEPVTWDGTEQSVSFNVNSLRYTFPKGFCKNDKNYDVTLTIEALASETAGRKFDSPTVVGEAKFAIYPRTDAPRANLLVGRGENYYKYTGIITLLRPFTKSSISMHCGRISYSVAFREDTDATDREEEVEEIEAKPLPKPLPKPRPSRNRKKPVLPSKEPEPLNQDAENQLSEVSSQQYTSQSSVGSYLAKHGLSRNKEFEERLKLRRMLSPSTTALTTTHIEHYSTTTTQKSSNGRLQSSITVLPISSTIQMDHSTAAAGKMFTGMQKLIVETFGKEKLRELARGAGSSHESIVTRGSTSLPFVSFHESRVESKSSILKANVKGPGNNLVVESKSSEVIIKKTPEVITSSSLARQKSKNNLNASVSKKSISTSERYYNSCKMKTMETQTNFEEKVVTIKRKLDEKKEPVKKSEKGLGSAKSESKMAKNDANKPEVIKNKRRSSQPAKSRTNGKEAPKPETNRHKSCAVGESQTIERKPAIHATIRRIQPKWNSREVKQWDPNTRMMSVRSVTNKTLLSDHSRPQDARKTVTRKTESEKIMTSTQRHRKPTYTSTTTTFTSTTSTTSVVERRSLPGNNKRRNPSTESKLEATKKKERAHLKNRPQLVDHDSGNDKRLRVTINVADKKKAIASEPPKKQQDLAPHQQPVHLHRHRSPSTERKPMQGVAAKEPEANGAVRHRKPEARSIQKENEGEVRKGKPTRNIRVASSESMTISPSSASSKDHRPNPKRSISDHVATSFSSTTKHFTDFGDFESTRDKTRTLSANLRDVFNRSDLRLGTGGVSNLLKTTGSDDTQLKVIFSCLDRRADSSKPQQRDVGKDKRAAKNMTDPSSDYVLENLRKLLASPEPFVPTSHPQQPPFHVGTNGATFSRFDSGRPQRNASENTGFPNWQDFLRQKLDVKQEQPKLRGNRATRRHTIPTTVQTSHPEVLSKPQASRPEALPRPQSSRPEALPKPQASRPEVLPKPQSSRPEVLSKPQASRPEVLPKPQVSQPEVLSKPQASQPEVLSKPQASQPEVLSKPQASQPEVLSKPQVSRPEVLSKPQASQPEVLSKPQVSRPEVLPKTKATRLEEQSKPKASRPEATAAEKSEAKKRRASIKQTGTRKSRNKSSDQSSSSVNAEALAQLTALQEKRRRILDEISEAMQREESFFGKNFFRFEAASTSPGLAPFRANPQEALAAHAKNVTEKSTQVRERRHCCKPKADITAISDMEKRLERYAKPQDSVPFQALDKSSIHKGRSAEEKGKDAIAIARVSTSTLSTVKVDNSRDGYETSATTITVVTQKNQDMFDCISEVNKANRQADTPAGEGGRDKEVASEGKQNIKIIITNPINSDTAKNHVKHKTNSTFITAGYDDEPENEARASTSLVTHGGSQLETMNQFLSQVAHPGLAEKIHDEVMRSQNMLMKYEPKLQKKLLREILANFLPEEQDISTQTSRLNLMTQQRQKFLSKKELKTLAEVVEIFRARKANQYPVFTARGVEWADGDFCNRPGSGPPMRPTAFEGSYDPIARRYEPVLKSNSNNNRRRNSVGSRRSSVASDAGGGTKEKNLRKYVLNKNGRRTSLQQIKEDQEEKKVKELLYVKMKERMLEYKNEENKMRKVLPHDILPDVYAQNLDDVQPKRRIEQMSAIERNPITGLTGETSIEHKMMLKPIFDKAVEKASEEKKRKRNTSSASTMQPSARSVSNNYRKRQRDRLRNVVTKPVTPPPPTPPPPVKEVRSIEVQTSSPIPSATYSDRYNANGIGNNGGLEPFTKDQATSTYEDGLQDDVHISISSRDNITSPPQDHQIYKRTRDSPTGYPNNSRIPQLTSFSSTTNTQPQPQPQQQQSNQTTARKKKTHQAPPPRKIIRKNKTNENSRNGTQTSSMKASNNSITPIRHVSKPGYEDVYVAIHGATSLPSCSDGSDPTPFASLKTGTEDRNDVKAVCTTHAAYQPTHSPTWEEAFTLQVPEGNVANEDIVLSVADSVTKDQLISYQIPIEYLEPFHTYHLELVQPTPAIPHGIRMYVTIQRKMSHLQRIQAFGYCALEVTLRDFQHELKNPPGSLLAVTRIVPDYTGYNNKLPNTKTKPKINQNFTFQPEDVLVYAHNKIPVVSGDLMLTRRPFAAGIHPQIINFPSPGRHNFIRSSENSQGYPQLSLPSTADKQPDWGHTFLFSHNEAATMFSRQAAIVVEYYPASSMITPVTWAVRSPVGFSVIHLDEDTLQALTSDPGRLGIRIDDVLVQSSNYETVEGPYPSVRLVLRLISTERPDTMVAAGNVEMLPQLDTLIPTSNTDFTPTPQMVADEYFQPRTPTPHSLPPTPLSNQNDTARLTAFGGDTTRNQQQNKLLVKEDEFPPDDAIENILPEYSLTPNDLQLYNVPTNSTIPIPRAGETRIQQRQQQPRHLPKQPSNLTTTTDRNMASVIDQREKELNRYKDAVKRMSHDIVNLRQENLGLKSNNQLLRRDVNESKDNAAALLSYRSNISHPNPQFDPGLVDSAELAQELEEVNQKLAKDSLDLQKYKSKVQHLQNQVIKANEREKNYLSEEMTRQQLQDAITDLHKKVKKTHKLEETVLKQEDVILKMEDLLKKFQKEAAESKAAAAAAAAKAVPALPAKEDVLASLTTQNNRLHTDLQKLKETTDSESKDLRARLERAENRASSLEQQLVRNAREWAREKQELTVRLQEHRNGIIRKNTNA